MLSQKSISRHKGKYIFWCDENTTQSRPKAIHINIKIHENCHLPMKMYIVHDC